MNNDIKTIKKYRNSSSIESKEILHSKSYERLLDEKNLEIEKLKENLTKLKLGIADKANFSNDTKQLINKHNADTNCNYKTIVASQIRSSMDKTFSKFEINKNLNEKKKNHYELTSRDLNNKSSENNKFSIHIPENLKSRYLKKRKANSVFSTIFNKQNRIKLNINKKEKSKSLIYHSENKFNSFNDHIETIKSNFKNKQFEKNSLIKNLSNVNFFKLQKNGNKILENKIQSKTTQIFNNNYNQKITLNDLKKTEFIKKSSILKINNSNISNKINKTNKIFKKCRTLNNKISFNFFDFRNEEESNNFKTNSNLNESNTIYRNSNFYRSNLFKNAFNSIKILFNQNNFELIKTHKESHSLNENFNNTVVSDISIFEKLDFLKERTRRLLTLYSEKISNSNILK